MKLRFESFSTYFWRHYGSTLVLEVLLLCVEQREGVCGKGGTYEKVSTSDAQNKRTVIQHD